jgi:hypothetical protein
MMVPDEHAAATERWLAAAAQVGSRLEGYAVLFLPGDSGDWVDSGISVTRGQQITLLAEGRIWLSREADLCFGPNVALWYRVGEGLIARSRGNSVTIAAGEQGTISLIAKPPGEWATRHGDFLPDYPHSGSSGGLLVAVLVWSGPVDEGLETFAAAGGTVAEAEIARRRAERPLPRGWQPLWRVGETGMFWESTTDDGHKIITCQCHNDAAILKYPLEIALDESLQLRWSWRIRRIPSRIPEDSLPGHDYVSVAIEFDNGQDLTYLWSCSLPEGTTFRCPIPWWDRHETHVVARSGTLHLGLWTSESKPVMADYLEHIGGEVPSHVIGVWLISLSPFQRAAAEWDCRQIELRTAGKTLRIGP